MSRSVKRTAERRNSAKIGVGKIDIRSQRDRFSDIAVVHIAIGGKGQKFFRRGKNERIRLGKTNRNEREKREQKARG